MSDGNPPDSWYAPPDDCPYEINDGREPLNGTVCSRCGDPSYISVEIKDTRVRYGGGTWQEVCETHYGTVIEDFLRELRAYEPEEYRKEE